MSSVSISIVGSNGDVIELREDTGNYLLPKGLSGTGLIPRQLATIDSAEDGTTVVGSRPGSRSILLPLLMRAAGRTEMEALLRRLSNALRVTGDRPPPRLVWTLESGQAYELPIYYRGGGETEWQSETGSPTRVKWFLQLTAPKPYWSAVDAINLPLLQTASAEPFLPDLVELHVAASQVLGAVTIENPGDVPSPVTWIIHGPADSATFVSSAGETFTLGEFDDSTIITVDSLAKTVVDQAGENQYGLLGTAPRLFHLPGGTSVVSIEIEGATGDTTVTGYYRPRLEVVH